MSDECCSGATSVLFSFLLGGIMGAGIALLLAPQTGVETRRKIGELSGDFRDRADEYTEQAKDTVASALEKGKELLDDKKSVLTSAIEAGKEAFRKEKSAQEEPAAES